MPHDQVREWEDGLTLPLPGETFNVDDASFDDSFDQINQ